MGANAAGLAPSIAFDIDPILTSSFASNHRYTKLVRADLSQVQGSDIRREVGSTIDGLFGGPPCQGFSAIGHRNPDDLRRSLVGHFFRLIAELQPTFFVMENVKGLGYADAVPVLHQALEQIPSAYELLGPVTLDAADFGAATRRQRLFVIGYDPQRMNRLTLRDIEAKKTKPATVCAAISDLVSAIEVESNDDFDLWQIRHRGRPSEYAASLRSKDGLFTGHKRTAHTAAVVKRFKKVKQGETEIIGRHPRLHWEGQCPTLRAGTGSDRGSFQSVRPLHPDEPRVITVREAARLQGFPDSFKFHPTIWHSFRMIGNSVSPIIAAVIFELLAERMNVKKTYGAAAE